MNCSIQCFFQGILGIPWGLSEKISSNMASLSTTIQKEYQFLISSGDHQFTKKQDLLVNSKCATRKESFDD